MLFVSNSISRDYIVVQSTTSTANTGLLDVLSEEFLKDTGIEIRAVTVGTGTAISNTQNGDGTHLIRHYWKKRDKFHRTATSILALV